MATAVARGLRTSAREHTRTTMSDFTSGRAMASRYAAWALLNLLVAGPALGLLSAYDATTDGGLSLQYPIFNTHAWMTLMGWCVPVLFALVYWLLPVLKESSARLGAVPGLSLVLLVLGNIGLAAYLFLAHNLRPALFVLPMVWGAFLVAGILYAATVSRLTIRTLRPTATDLGLQAGSVWLLVILAVRCAVALGALATGRHDFLASSEPAIRYAMLFGFIANTGLALAAAIVPPFLGTPHPRAMALTSFRIYNGAIGIWCGGAAWVLPYPYSWGRLLLVLAGFAFVYAVLRLLVDLRLFALLTATSQTTRRLLTRTALATGAIVMLAAALVIALLSIWAAATLHPPPPQMLALPMHLMAVGLFSNLVLAMYIPICGSRSMASIKGFLAWGAYVMLTAWLIGKVGLAVSTIIADDVMWRERYFAGWAVGGGMAFLALWLAAALRPVRRTDDA